MPEWAHRYERDHPVTVEGREPREACDFWEWALCKPSDVQRGLIAEYLIAVALDVDDKPYEEWARWDLMTKSGVTVQVKASAYLQPWEQRHESRPGFRFAKKRGEENIGGRFIRYELDHHADVYVFALHNHHVRETLDMFDGSQWEFWVFAKRKLPPQDSISVKSLRAQKFKSVGIGALGAAIEEAHRKANA